MENEKQVNFETKKIEDKENINSDEEFEEIKEELFEFKNTGDTIEGELIQVRKEVGKFKSIIYSVRCPNGKIKAFFGSKILNEKLGVVGLGEYIKVVFKGKRKSEDEKTEYNVFKVFRKK